MTQDVKKYFFQLRLSRKNPVNIVMLWTTNTNGENDPSKRTVLLFENMLWGMNSSMTCIIATTQFHLMTVMKHCPKDEVERLSRLLGTMYVDDIIETAETEEDLVKAAENNIRYFYFADMIVTSTRSNSKKVRGVFWGGGGWGGAG